MAISKLQIPPPANWTDFEDLCHSLFKAHWKDPLAQMHGRRGQAQHGVDVFGSPEAAYGANLHGVQCKGKEANYGASATEDELKAECAKALKFTPALNHWTLVTTAPRDAKLQKAARLLSKRHAKQGKFGVQYMGWDDLTELLVEHPAVLRKYYPNHADNIPDLIDAVKEMGAKTDEPSAGAIWQPVAFAEQRDLSAALSGKKLGPTDAISCPTLVEANTAKAELQSNKVARLVGVPGVGKSVCAYQTAHQFYQMGWQVYRLANSQIKELPSIDGLKSGKMLLVLDDAHLMPDWLLTSIESLASDRLCILSTLNAYNHETSISDDIVIDPKRAVRTIATALREDLETTVTLVSNVDSRVGHRMMDEDIERRLDEALTRSEQPWQFCFTLGGGWHRSKKIADNARAQGADIVLAVCAALQIASQDAPAGLSEINRYAPELNQETSEDHINRLVKGRVLLNTYDCRTPHQRFAAALLKEILESQTQENRILIGTCLSRMIACENLPLAGIRNLLHELYFAGNYRWSHLVSVTAAASLIERCWRADTPDEINIAALTLSELCSYSDEIFTEITRGRQESLSKWVDNVVHPSGYGVGRLLHNAHTKDADWAIGTLMKCDKKRFAANVSAVTPTNAYTTASLITSVGQLDQRKWMKQAGRMINQGACVALAENWPSDEQAFSFARFCLALGWLSEEMPLVLAEAFVPQAQIRLSLSPLEAMSDLDDIIMPVLHLLDPLGLGRRPSKHQLRIGRAYLEKLDAEVTAAQLMSSRFRHLQTITMFLSFVRRCSGKLYNEIVDGLDWDKVHELIRGNWSNPAHETEVLLGALSATETSRKRVVAFIDKHLSDIEQFPPRWGLLSENAMVAHVRAGKTLKLCQYQHIDWYFGAFALAILAENDDSLLDLPLRDLEPAMIQWLKAQNSSWYRQSEIFLRIIDRLRPTFLQRVLSKADPGMARKGWVESLRKHGAVQHSVAFLIEKSLDLDAPIAELAATLRTQFPKSSKPRDLSQKSIEELLSMNRDQ